jgi:glycosyltransferase involved in cell wall biosynthesis
MFDVRCSLFPVLVRRSMFDVRCSTFDVRRSTFDVPVRCSTFNVRRSTFDVRCSMFDVPLPFPPPSVRSTFGRSASRTPDITVTKRIAFFTGNYNLVPDGVARTLNRLVAYLEDTGAEAIVVAPTARRPSMVHTGTLLSVPSVPAPFRSEYRISLGLPRTVRKRLAEFNPNLFHIATPDLLGNRALRLARRWGVPAVASYHTHFCSYLRYYRLEEFEGFVWKYLRRFYRQCRHVYVASQSMAAVLQTHEISQGLRLWERGVDTSLFSHRKRSMEWRQSLGVSDNEPLLVFVGRTVREKGLTVFTEVVRTLELTGARHRSMVVGDGPALTYLKERLPNTVFTGFLEGQSLSRAYASADVLLFPSDTETFGNVTLEAMASGLPVVCADATGSSSLVIHEVTGFLAPPGEVSYFRDYAVLLLTDRELRHRMGRAARERSQNYDWGTAMERIVAYYDEVLNPDSAQHLRSATRASAV